jgi:hypothetical protein
VANEIESQGQSAGFRWVCTACGAVAKGDRCWLCGSTLIGASAESRPLARDERGAHTFTLSSLFLWITLISVFLGVTVAAPGLGILLFIFSVPALVRASAAQKRAEASSRPANAFDRVGMFLSSLGVLALIALAGIAAFLAACWVSCAAAVGLSGRDKYGFPTGGEAFLFAAWIAGGVLAIGLVAWLLWKTWPRKRK